MGAMTSETVETKLYTVAELSELRRVMMTLPESSARSRAQSAPADSEIGSPPFRNDLWLAAHTVDGGKPSPLLKTVAGQIVEAMVREPVAVNPMQAVLADIAIFDV